MCSIDSSHKPAEDCSLYSTSSNKAPGSNPYKVEEQQRRTQGVAQQLLVHPFASFSLCPQQKPKEQSLGITPLESKYPSKQQPPVEGRKSIEEKTLHQTSNGRSPIRIPLKEEFLKPEHRSGQEPSLKSRVTHLDPKQSGQPFSGVSTQQQELFQNVMPISEQLGTVQPPYYYSVCYPVYYPVDCPGEGDPSQSAANEKKQQNQGQNRQKIKTRSQQTQTKKTTLKHQSQPTKPKTDVQTLPEYMQVLGQLQHSIEQVQHSIEKLKSSPLGYLKKELVREQDRIFKEEKKLQLESNRPSPEYEVKRRELNCIEYFFDKKKPHLQEAISITKKIRKLEHTEQPFEEKLELFKSYTKELERHIKEIGLLPTRVGDLLEQL